MFNSSKNTSSVSIASNATYTSTSPFQSSPPPQFQKDFSAAFTSLQSSFGFGGGAPSRPANSKPSQSKAVKEYLRSQATLNQTVLPTGAKDFEASFGALSSTYGFGGTPFAPHSKSSGKLLSSK